MYAQLNPRPVVLVTNQSQQICPCIQRRFHADMQAQYAAISGQLSIRGNHTPTFLRGHVSVNDWRLCREAARTFQEGARHRWRPAQDYPFRSLHSRTRRCSLPERPPGLNNGVLFNIRCDARKCNQNPYHPLQCNTCKRLYLLCTFSDNTSPGRRRFYSFLQ